MINIIIFLLLNSILLSSNDYLLNLVFKDINVRSGDSVYLENSKDKIGSIVSNKISNNYNIVAVKINGDYKIPLNSIFKHDLVGSLRKNAIVINLSNKTIKYKNNDVIIVDFKGVTTICDNLETVKKEYNEMIDKYEIKQKNLITINEKIEKNELIKLDLEKNIDRLNKDFSRIDTIVANEKRNKLSKLEDIEINIKSKASQLSSLNTLFTKDSLSLANIKDEIQIKESNKNSLKLELNTFENDIIDKKSEIKTLTSKYDSIISKLNKAENQYNEIISFVKENVIAIKEYDEAPIPKNGISIQEIIFNSLPEKLKGVYSGYVVIDVFIGENGRVESINDIKSTPWSDDYSDDIEDHLYDVISAINWIPAKKGNKYIGISHKIAISFN